MRFLKVPSLKQATNLVLVAPEEEDINIFMSARLFSEKEVNGPAACNPPGDWQRREKLSDLMWLPRLPCYKRRGLSHLSLTYPVFDDHSEPGQPSPQSVQGRPLMYQSVVVSPSG